MQLNGKLTISRVLTNTAEDYIQIIIQDDLSCAQYCKVQVSFDNFAQALTGLALVNCLHETRGLSVIGKKRENRSAIVSIPDAILEPAVLVLGDSSRERIENLVDFVKSQVEVDGWELSSHFTDILNRRNWQKKDVDSRSVAVSLVRFV